MSPSTPLAINRPDPLVPQWRTRPISTTGLLAPPVATPWMYAALVATSDVKGQYFTFEQSNGVAGAESIDYWVYSEGVLYQGNQPAAADSTVYYVYLDEDADALLDSVNVTPMKSNFAWDSHTISCWIGHDPPIPAGSNFQGWVRYEQL